MGLIVIAIRLLAIGNEYDFRSPRSTGYENLAASKRLFRYRTQRLLQLVDHNRLNIHQGLSSFLFETIRKNLIIF